MPDASDAGDAEVGEPGFAAAIEKESGRNGRREEDSDRDGGSDEGSDNGEGAFGEAVPAAPIEPETPSVENAAFVVLGVASMIALVLHLSSLLG